MRKTRTILVLIVIYVLLASLVSGCSKKEQEVERIKNLDYTIVPDANVPEELMKLIEEKKEEPFKLTFTSSEKEYLYLVVGYGVQRTGGYSISVDDFFLAKNAIYIDTTLIGPKKDELVTVANTYPYIVVKTLYLDENVVFR